MTLPSRLTPEQLYTPCNLSLLPFKDTRELSELTEFVGQSRAISALEFGVNIQRRGFNMFVMGPSGIGKHTLVNEFLKKLVDGKPAPEDWCYVNNFHEPDKPKAISLASGRGSELRKDMQQLIEELRTAIPVAFEAKEYQEKMRQIEESLKDQIEQAFADLAEEAEAKNLRLVRTPWGFSFSPTKSGKLLTEKEYGRLSEAEKKSIDALVVEYEEKLRGLIQQQSKWQRETREKVTDINFRVAMLASGGLIEALKKKYQDAQKVIDYLDSVQQDVIDNLKIFRGVKEAGSEEIPLQGLEKSAFFKRYAVNVIISHANKKTVPVIYEDSPQHQNIIGRIEHVSQMGALATDFTLIKPGALHRANGGYLVLDVVKVLTQPYAWEGLKSALRSHEIRIQSIGQIYGLVSTVSLEPEPIPLNMKVILLGEPRLYYLLMEYDPEFAELFKVVSDLETDMDRNQDNVAQYAHLLAGIVKQDNLLPLSQDAVARMIEYGARLAEDSEKLSTHILSITDLVRESDHWAKQNKNAVITAADVQHTIEQQNYRQSRIQERIYDEIGRGTLMIDLSGEKIGQVNALSVIDLIKFAFAHPTRITANVSLGDGEVVDIQREVEMSGAIHSKGVLILSSFLAGRYTTEQPLSLRASLAFEQTYSHIDGDSASVAELCALISAITEIPIRQSLAITGSVNQHGQVQPIGGVNEKIEGFFDVCRRAGLDGSQGVIIPSTNVKHLMLRSDVVEAVKAGQFHITPIQTVDEAFELLTGVSAETFNAKVLTRLTKFAKVKHRFGKTKE